MNNDVIADMFVMIRNACKMRFYKVDIPFSSFKFEIIKVFKTEGFVKNFKILQLNKKTYLRIYLKYGDKFIPIIKGIQRVSKLSRRVYVKSIDVRRYMGGLGVSVFSTSKGVKTDRFVKREGIGGELLCHIW